MSAPQIWGGIECTVNRVRDLWLNQLSLTGHAARLTDLDAVAALGIRTLRYPVLWELHELSAGGAIDWADTDRRLTHLRALGISPIAGLVHHGSGPSFTDLLQDEFAIGLARYARRVAQRYPWIALYTPINEPLTTARFSALYGLWYPHHRDDRSFARALINQCRATVLSMREIRRVNPEAKLVQTEDLGKAFSTAHMRYQAGFENERRWLTWDLLCGRLDAAHPMRRYLLESGIGAAEIDWFLDCDCSPDIVGINHYVTSDRYLDERADRYPHAYHGANHREAYADVEAVRVLAAREGSWSRVIAETGQRYRLPIALTEVHLGCTREEQLRWFFDAWESAQTANRNGCDVRAVTAWALFGNVGWNSLLTGATEDYEVGAFDIRAPVPRETAVAGLIRDLIHGHRPRVLTLGRRGWWRRSGRLLYGSEADDSSICGPEEAISPTAIGGERPPLLITGAGGALWRAIADACRSRDIAFHELPRTKLDVGDAEAVRSVVRQLQPWAVVYVPPVPQIDRAEVDPERCVKHHQAGPATLATVLSQSNIPFLTFSSAQVYDGRQFTPYGESAPPAPLNAYGRIQARTDALVARTHEQSLIVRTSDRFGNSPQDWMCAALQALRAGGSFSAAADVCESLTFIPDLVDASLDLLIDRATGLWHVANRGCSSRAALIAHAANLLGLDTAGLDRKNARLARVRAPRAAYLALHSERGVTLPTLASAAERYVETHRARFAITGNGRRRRSA